VVVFVNGDRVPEADESLALELLSATGARIRRSEALGLVVDDDTAPGGPTVAVAGDVACDPADRAFAGNDPGACQHRATAALVGARPYVAILVPGDLQYERGELDAFRSSYGPTWGRFKARTRPAPGNHEYNTAGATGYYDYFGPAVGRRSEGWYSFDVGDWHVVALNSNCAAIGGCDDESRQAVWLRGDLARNPARCTLAFWHHPLFTSGAAHVGETVMAPLWRILEAAGADLVVAGHAHQYERFAPQTRDGAADPSGIREIVVGTGGRSHQPLAATVPNSLVRDATTFGILELTLGRSRYSWRFVPAVGPFRDSGSARCD
jgi:3',5'-cyclic AMP phosphodiesterase CpdA